MGTASLLQAHLEFSFPSKRVGPGQGTLGQGMPWACCTVASLCTCCVFTRGKAIFDFCGAGISQKSEICQGCSLRDASILGATRPGGFLSGSWCVLGLHSDGPYKPSTCTSTCGLISRTSVFEHVLDDTRVCRGQHERRERAPCGSKRDAWVTVTALRESETPLLGSCGRFFPQVYSTMAALLQFGLASKKLLQLQRAVGAFGCGHMRDLSRREFGVSIPE